MQLNWQRLRETVVGDFGELGLMVIAEEYIQLNQGPLSLETFTNKMLAFLRQLNVDTHAVVGDFEAPPPPGGNNIAALRQAYHDMAEGYTRAMRFIYLVARAKLARALSNRDLRGRLRSLPPDTSLNQLIYQSRTVLASAVDIDPKEGVQVYLPPRQRPHRSEPPRQDYGRQQGQRPYNNNRDHQPAGAGQQRRGAAPHERRDERPQQPQQQQRQGGHGAAERGQVRCFECNKFGHIAKDCPNPRRGGRHDKAAALMAEGVLGYNATLNFGDKSRTGRLLVDTGAGHSVISPHFVGDKIPTLTGPKIIGKSWTGQQLITDKYVDVELVSNEVSLPSRFAIMECPEGVDLVLGVDWLARHSASINVGTRQVKSLGRLVFGSDDVCDLGHSVIATLQVQANNDNVPAAEEPEVLQLRALLHQEFSDVFKDRLDVLPPPRKGYDFTGGPGRRERGAAPSSTLPPRPRDD
jgi:hypothetical protein